MGHYETGYIETQFFAKKGKTERELSIYIYISCYKLKGK